MFMEKCIHLLVSNHERFMEKVYVYGFLTYKGLWVKYTHLWVFNQGSFLIRFTLSSQKRFVRKVYKLIGLVYGQCVRFFFHFPFMTLTGCQRNRRRKENNREI